MRVASALDADGRPRRRTGALPPSRPRPSRTALLLQALVYYTVRRHAGAGTAPDAKLSAPRPVSN